MKFASLLVIFIFTQYAVAPSHAGWEEVAHIPAQDFYDCIYIFYTCTDKVGEWPDNKEICTKLFQDCCAQFESEESKPETSTKLELDVIEVSPERVPEIPSSELTIEPETDIDLPTPEQIIPPSYLEAQSISTSTNLPVGHSTAATPFLRIKGNPFKKEYYDNDNNDLHSKQFHDFPLDICGTYDYYHHDNLQETKMCEDKTSTGNFECREDEATKMWIQKEQPFKKITCPNGLYWSRTNNVFYFTNKKWIKSGLKISAKYTTDENHVTLEEHAQSCGDKDNLAILKIGFNDDLEKPQPCIFRLAKSQDQSEDFELKDCESVIQICENSNECHPLLDGKTKANIVFHLGNIVQKNQNCPKLILQMAPYNYIDRWTVEGSTFYVSHDRDPDSGVQLNTCWRSDGKLCEDYLGLKECKNGWSCKNGKCIDKNEVCNSQDDCGDNSDETEEICTDYLSKKNSIKS